MNDLLKSLMRDLAELDVDGICTISYDRDAKRSERWKCWIEPKDNPGHEIEKEAAEPELACAEVKLILEGMA